MLEYLSFRTAPSSAAEPASRAAPATYDESANGQVTVTSQHSALPLCQRPSGRFPSVRNSPVGSLVTGKPAEAKLIIIIIIIIIINKGVRLQISGTITINRRIHVKANRHD